MKRLTFAIMTEQSEILQPEDEKPITTVLLDDGSYLSIGDEVTTNFHAKCFGKTFVVLKMTKSNCQSGVMVLVHLKDNPGRLLKSSFKSGLDANWFKKIS